MGSCLLQPDPLPAGFLPLPLALLPPRAPSASLLPHVVGRSLNGKKKYLFSVDSLLHQRHGVEPYQALLVKVKEVGGDAGAGR